MSTTTHEIQNAGPANTGPDVTEDQRDQFLSWPANEFIDALGRTLFDAKFVYGKRLRKKKHFDRLLENVIHYGVFLPAPRPLFIEWLHLTALHAPKGNVMSKPRDMTIKVVNLQGELETLEFPTSAGANFDVMLH